jgi:hypothetical protein
MKRWTILTVVWVMNWQLTPAICAAASEGSLQIDNAVVSVGENGPAYYAQSFVAPNGTLDSATLKLASAGGNGDSFFRVLITDTSGGTGVGLHPTNVRFESPTLKLPLDLTYPINRNEFTTFVIPVGGIQLTSGGTYALVIDCFSDFDGVQNFMGTGLNANAYPNGHFFYYGIGFHEGDTGMRFAHFADDANWVDFLPQDMAFELHYTPAVPEPASFGTLAAIVVVSAVVQRRRR